MADLFHISFGPTAPPPVSNRLADVRWALSALDPRSRTRCGAFRASDGANVPYRFWAARNPRALVLLLHGACDYSGAYDDIAPRLARRGFTCLAYDQRGFGATETRGQWTSDERMVDDVADAVAFLRRRSGLDLPLFVIGESMGGAVAVHAAARFPNLDVAGLVLVAPGALSSAVKRMFYGVIARLTRAILGDTEVMFERLSGWELSPAAAIRLLGDPLVMRGIKPDLFAGIVSLAHSAVSEAHKVNVPVMTLVAGKDDLLRQACIRRLHDNFAGEKIWKLVKDGPHLLLHWKRGDVVLYQARRWLESTLKQSRKPSTSAAGLQTGTDLTASIPVPALRFSGVSPIHER